MRTVAKTVIGGAKSRDTLSTLAIVFLVCLSYLVVIAGGGGVREYNLIVALMLLNGAIALIGIVADSRPFTIAKMHWYFQLVFMSMAPLAQYLKGYYPSRYLISDEYYLRACIVVLIWNCCFHLFTSIGKERVAESQGKLIKAAKVERDFTPLVRTVAACSVITCFLVLLWLIGFDNLFVKAENTLALESSTLSFVVKKMLSALPAAVCVICLLSPKKSASTWMLFALSFLVTVLLNFPTSTTRYWMGTIYLGILLVWSAKTASTRWVDFALLAVLLVVFPMFYIFKYVSLGDAQIDFASFLSLPSTFCSIDYDAFMLLARTIQYVDVNGISAGYQLVNILLFFIPRALWPGKPHPSNIVVASSQGSAFTNLSCPLPAEGYINFGVVGVVLFCFVVARFALRLDASYWDDLHDRSKLNFLNASYPFLAVIIIYISRGPLQPSFIQTIALLLPFLLLFFILPRKPALINEKQDVRVMHKTANY